MEITLAKNTRGYYQRQLRGGHHFASDSTQKIFYKIGHFSSRIIDTNREYNHFN